VSCMNNQPPEMVANTSSGNTRAVNSKLGGVVGERKAVGSDFEEGWWCSGMEMQQLLILNAGNDPEKEYQM
jgi:hypothetical protein